MQHSASEYNIIFHEYTGLHCPTLDVFIASNTIDSPVYTVYICWLSKHYYYWQLYQALCDTYLILYNLYSQLSSSVYQLVSTRWVCRLCFSELFSSLVWHWGALTLQWWSGMVRTNKWPLLLAFLCIVSSYLLLPSSVPVGKFSARQVEQPPTPPIRTSIFEPLRGYLGC